VAQSRKRWRDLQPRLHPERLVFIDKTRVKTSMTPLRGWGPRGERFRAYAPYGYWRTLTFLATLRADRLTAPCVFDGPINGESFRLYVREMLLPELKPGDIVVMDNLGSHKGAEVRSLVRSCKARFWFLPPYSPDLNPIEQAFAKIKHAMRLAQQRTVAEVTRARGDIIRTISNAECRNYIANSGYASADH
jgi:transposase